MIGDKRRDLYRFGTAAVAVATIALVILHFRGRGEAIEDARAKVAALHAQSKNAMAARVEEFRSALARWDGEAEYPPFRAGKIERQGESPSPLMVQFGEGPTRCWVQTFVRDTDPPQEGEFLLGGGGRLEEGFELRKAGRRDEQFKITLTVSVEDAAAAEGAETDVAVLLRRGPAEEPQLRTIPIKAVKGAGPSEHEIAELKGLDPNLRVRQDVVFRVEKGKPAVKVVWKAVRRGYDGDGTVGTREIAIGVLKDLPEKPGVLPGEKVPGARPEVEDEWQNTRVKMPARRVFTVGYVPLDTAPAVMGPAQIEQDATAQAVRIEPGIWLNESFEPVDP